jgi:hypothetical protein
MAFSGLNAELQQIQVFHHLPIFEPGAGCMQALGLLRRGNVFVVFGAGLDTTFAHPLRLPLAND